MGRAAIVVQSYRLRSTPRIKLSGLTGSFDEFTDGAMLDAVASWWNRFLDRRPALVDIGFYRRYDAKLHARFLESVNPGNHALLRSAGAEHAPLSERVGESAIALAYSFARVLSLGSPYEDWSDDEAFAIPPNVTSELLEHLGKRYSIVADYHFDFPSSGWWSEREGWGLGYRWGVRAIRWTYRNQVARWEKGFGRRLGKGIGFAFGEDEFVTDFRDRLFELGGRFAEAEFHGAGSA